MGYHEYYTRVRDDYDVVGARAKAQTQSHILPSGQKRAFARR